MVFWWKGKKNKMVCSWSLHEGENERMMLVMQVKKFERERETAWRGSMRWFLSQGTT